MPASAKACAFSPTSWIPRTSTRLIHPLISGNHPKLAVPAGAAFPTWNQEKIDNLTIPSIEGYEDSLDDPNMTTVAEVFFNASNVQLWYDQYLPASVTEVHKDCMNALFGLESTPQEIGEQHDAAMQEYLASR